MQQEAPQRIPSARCKGAKQQHPGARRCTSGMARRAAHAARTTCAPLPAVEVEWIPPGAPPVLVGVLDGVVVRGEQVRERRAQEVGQAMQDRQYGPAHLPRVQARLRPHKANSGQRGVPVCLVGRCATLEDVQL